MPLPKKKDVELVLKNFSPSSSSMIREVKEGPELLSALYRSKELELLADPLQHFKEGLRNVRSVTQCEGYLEKLSGDVNRLVIKRYGKTAEGATLNEQKDSGEVEEPPPEGQNTLQQEAKTPPLQTKISVAPGGQSPDTTSDESRLVQPISQMRKDPPNNLISTDEKNMIEKIFNFIDATPRKMKRVVNVYVLQRSLFLPAYENRGVIGDEEKYLRRALATWTILVEFWPMRLSWVIHEMEASQNPDDNSIKDPHKTIANFYGDEATENSACALIHGILSEIEGMKTLYFSDATEKSFRMVVKHGEKITKSLVLRPGGLLEHSFNLNPTIITLVENIKQTCIQGRKASMGVEEKKGD